MNWFRKLFSKPKPDALARFRSEPLKLTLEEWQKNEQLMSGGMGLAADPVFRALVAVLLNESPANWGLKIDGTPPYDRAALQAVTQGYLMALNNIGAMTTPAVILGDMPIVTFAPEEHMEG